MSSQGTFSHVERANLDPEFIRAMEEVMNFDSEDDDDDDVWDEPEADYDGADKSPGEDVYIRVDAIECNRPT